MEPFRCLARFTVARNAGFFTLAAATLMVAYSFNLHLAFVIAANVALIFSISLMVRASRMDEERVTRTEAWCILAPEERPPGEGGRCRARGDLELLWLYYAKGAAFAAVLLAGAFFFFGQNERAGEAAAREAGLPAQMADTVVR